MMCVEFVCSRLLQTAVELLLVGGSRPSWKNNGAENDDDDDEV